MARYRLKHGRHIGLGPDGKGKTYEQGDIIETDDDLTQLNMDELSTGKFELLDQDAKEKRENDLNKGKRLQTPERASSDPYPARREASTDKPFASPPVEKPLANPPSDKPSAPPAPSETARKP